MKVYTFVKVFSTILCYQVLIALKEALLLFREKYKHHLISAEDRIWNVLDEE